MRCLSIFMVAVGACVANPLWGGTALGAAAADPHSVTFVKDIQPFFAKYCYECHGNEVEKGSVNFQNYGPHSSMVEDRKFWETVIHSLEAKEMPPKKKTQPSDEDRSKVVHYIQGELAKFNCNEINPGRVTLRRLNRAEYNNTIRDLVGVDFKPAADFPSDEVGFGFDNIGDVLSLPPILMEKYLDAAEQIATKAILIPVGTPFKRIAATSLPATTDAGPLDDKALVLYKDGEVFTEHHFVERGEYIIRAKAYGQQAGPDPARMAIRLDNKEVKAFDVHAVDSKPEVYETRVRAQPGKQRLAVAYLNNYNSQNHPDPAMRGDRNLVVEYLEVVGPVDQAAAKLPDSHKKIFTCEAPGHQHNLECAHAILGNFARRAYRRPVSDEEVRRLVRFVELVQSKKGAFEEGIQVAVQAVLVSPQFLFRWELDTQQLAAGTIRDLSDFELASRLSYFIWSSMPDDELLALADRGQLRKPEVLRAQALRMIQNPKARALVDNFAGQWLQIRAVDNLSPDPAQFPNFDDRLRLAMKRETELFFEAIMKEGRSIMEFLDADFTFVNERLARHYGIPNVKGEQFQRVKLDPRTQRGGILTQASVLAITSNPTRTSPVNRGKWILEQILGTPPPPPPPDVEELEEDEHAIQSASLRQRLEMHRAKAECATCHNKMDPIGFAFENFDAVGAWRETDAKFPIDPSGTLPSGQSFNGPNELKAILKTQDTFIRTVAEKMLTFALGRGLQYYDKCTVDNLCEALAQNQYKFPVLITEIVTSEPFIKKQGKGD